jgi:Adenylate cyclase, family 3 (some proteins contain HAMP domain)
MRYFNLEMLKQTTEFSFLNDNYALDLRILGATGYQQSGTIPHLLKWCKGMISVQETADEITKSWNAITRQYGLNEQRSFYRNVLGLPEYSDSGKERNIAKLESIIVGVTIPFGVIALFLSFIVAKQRRTIKFQTREVSNAPKTGTIALVFTDIEGSTVLWEMDKRAMQKSLEIHHNVIRNCIEKYQAYEVKTVGDAFMIAVDSADKAVLLANDIQWNLLNEEWPLELAAMPPSCVEYFRTPPQAREPPRPMFKGLRVRIGVHVGQYSSNVESGGQIHVTHDSVTKGYDYYGSAVNAAARIEDVGFGGQTVISQTVHDMLSVDVKALCVLECIGEVELRGIQEKLILYNCLPKSLRGRRFQGIYRRKQSMDVLDTVKFERISYRDVDVMTLTPVELQQGMKQLQDTIFSLETKLSSYEEKITVSPGNDTEDEELLLDSDNVEDTVNVTQ